MMRARALFLLFVAAAAPAPGNRSQDAGGDSRAPAPPAPRPNLVLVTIDTLRSDHLSCYGYFRKTSPFIDSLAGESLLFERCSAAISHTTPSHASILTSVLPIEHGITENAWLVPTNVKRARALVTTPQLQSYAQILKSHGWSTAGFVSAATTAKITGLAAGFDAWSEPKEGKDDASDDDGDSGEKDELPARRGAERAGERGGDRRPGVETLADAKAWLAKSGDQPFFLWVHLFDVHGPHRKNEPSQKYEAEFPDDDALREQLARRGIKPSFEGRKGGTVRPGQFNARYDASIRYTDDLVAELVAALKATGAWERTTFVLTGDHGEGLGEHDFVGHELAWGEQLGVPLIVRAPGHAAERIGQLMSLVDVLPTVVDLTPGLPRDELLAQATGRSVVADSFEPRPVFSMAARESEFAIANPRWKFVRRPGNGESLYDLKEDPFELHDVKEAHEKIAELLGAQLDAAKALQEKRREWLRQGGVEPKLTPEQEQEQRERLQSLGYGK